MLGVVSSNTPISLPYIEVEPCWCKEPKITTVDSITGEISEGYPWPPETRKLFEIKASSLRAKLYYIGQIDQFKHIRKFFSQFVIKAKNFYRSINT